MPPIDAFASHLVTVACSVITALIVALVTRSMNRKMDATETKRDEERRRIEALSDGVTSLLRSELVRAHRDYCEQQGYLTLEQREFIQRTYSAYKSLGGNDVGHILYGELMELKTKEER